MPLKVKFMCYFLNHFFYCKCRKKYRKSIEKAIHMHFKVYDEHNDNAFFAFLIGNETMMQLDVCRTCLIVSLLEEY